MSDTNPSSRPPRRTIKACAACRSEKVKCDGLRPCAPCLKRHKQSQCSDGCVHCRQKRVQCTGSDNRPCEQCRRDGVQCVDDPSLLPRPPSDEERTVPKVPGERVKLACAACRRDNKKCQETRPCARCVSRREECIHMERCPKIVKVRCDGCRLNHKRCEEARPCVFCLEKEIECTQTTRKGGQGTRVKAACLPCRKSKLRCNGGRPCAACTRRGLDCVEKPCPLCVESGRDVCHHRQKDDHEVQLDSQPLSPPEATSRSPQPFTTSPGQLFFSPFGGPPPPIPGLSTPFLALPPFVSNANEPPLQPLFAPHYSATFIHPGLSLPSPAMFLDPSLQSLPSPTPQDLNLASLMFTVPASHHALPGAMMQLPVTGMNPANTTTSGQSYENRQNP